MKNLLKSLLPKIGTDTDFIRFSWVKSQLEKLPNGLSILDAGAGELRFKQYCSHLIYTSQDFGEYDGTGDKKGLQTITWDNSNLDIVSDITQIPVPEKTFDVILCSEVFEHIPDAVAALKEFDRILKPNGIILITAPFNSLTHFAPYHFCGYNHYWYKYHFNKLDYSIEAIDHNGSWFSFIAQELRRGGLVSRTYSIRLLGILFLFFSVPLFYLLSLLNKADNNSHELLCFGFMVKARKNKI